MLKNALAVISVAGFILISVLCLVAAQFGEEWSQKMMDTILPMVIQCWILNFTVIIQHKYGSSAGSEEKGKAIEGLLERMSSKEEEK